MYDDRSEFKIDNNLLHNSYYFRNLKFSIIKLIALYYTSNPYNNTYDVSYINNAVLGIS